MGPFEDWQLINIAKVRSNAAVAPAGVVRARAGSWSLADLRSACLEPARKLMETNDVFLIPSSNSSPPFYPISHDDEQRISVNEYFSATRSTNSIYCGNIDGPSTYTSSDARETATGNDASDGLVLNVPYLLTCWGGGEVTSILTTRLPDDILSENASFSVFARTTRDGPRVILSVECPFYDESILEIGTQKGKKEIYAKSIACEDTLYSRFSVDNNNWTHISLVLNTSTQVLMLYVNGTLAKMVTLDKKERLAFMQLPKTLGMVLGRGKSKDRMRHGWNGEIADVRVWRRVLDETEIANLAKQTPQLLNPNAKFDTYEC